MNDNEDLLDIVTRQRLTIYHQERRIESLEKSLYQATHMNPINPTDLVNQLLNQLQTSNELMAAKAKIEALENKNAELRKQGTLLCSIILDITDVIPQDQIAKAICKSAIDKWTDISNV
jgi:hypothetical protein